MEKVEKTNFRITSSRYHAVASRKDLLRRDNDSYMIDDQPAAHWRLLDDDADYDWMSPDAQHPAEIPAWRLMEKSLMMADEHVIREQAVSAPLDRFEVAASKIGAPLNKDCQFRGYRNYRASSVLQRAFEDYAEEDEEEECDSRYNLSSLRQVTETLDAALYTFTKSYEAKELREKEAQEVADKRRADDRKVLEREVREAHSLQLIDAAVALEDLSDAEAALKGGCCGQCCACDERDNGQSCPCFCFGTCLEEETPVVPQQSFEESACDQTGTTSLAVASQNVQNELDLALAMMQKRLGGNKPFVGHDGTEFVPKGADTKPADPIVLVETAEDKAKRDLRQQRAEEFDRKTRDAGLRALGETGEECDDPFGCSSAQLQEDINDEAIDRILAATDEEEEACRDYCCQRLGAPETQSRHYPAHGDSHRCLRTIGPSLHSNDNFRVESDYLADARARLDQNRQRRRLVESAGVIGRTLDARECLAKARTLREAVSSELRRRAT